MAPRYTYEEVILVALRRKIEKLGFSKSFVTQIERNYILNRFQDCSNQIKKKDPQITDEVT